MNGLFGMVIGMMNPGGAEGPGAGGMPLLMIVALIAIFYLLLIRPQMKHQKKLQSMRGSIKNGDQVLTSGGIYGTVAGMEEDIIVLKIAEGVKVRVSRTAISGVSKDEEKK